MVFPSWMSIEEEVIPTKAMGKQLYEEYKELEKAFVEKYEMSRILRTEEFCSSDHSSDCKNVEK